MLDMMKTEARRSILRYAVGRAMFCAGCRNVLDVSSAVYAEDEGRVITVLCCGCWGRNPMIVESGSVTVLDGRLLYAPKRARRSTRKSTMRK